MIQFILQVQSQYVKRAVDIDFGNYAVNRVYITTNDAGTMDLDGDQFINALLEMDAPNLVVNNYIAIFGDYIITSGTFNDF